MRKITAALIGTALAATALAGCAPAPGTSSSFGCTPLSSGDGTVLENVTVTGDVGSAPEISLPDGFTITSAEREEIVTGDGEQITAQSQVVALELTLINSTDGEVLSQTDYSAAASYTSVGNAVQAISTFGDSLMCARAGSRVVAAFPSDSLDPTTAAGLGLTASTGLLAIIDVVDVMLPAADGAPVFNGAWGLPSVVRTSSGHPGLVVPDSAAPTDVVTQTLLQGDGEEITSDSRAVINLLGTTWEADETTGKRSTFVDSWSDNAPQAVSMSDTSTLPIGFADALIGATVGSQVMIIVPASQNQTASENSTAPVGKTLIYVVDIVGTL